MSSSSPPAYMFLVIGSGPGIGVATASLFASKPHFSKVALVSRDPVRLQQDRSSVLDAAKEAGRPDVEVKAWSTDITSSPSLQATLAEVQNWGTISCVLFNAARVGPSDLATFTEEELMQDFKTTNTALLTTSQHLIPHLCSLPKSAKPTLLVTNSLLWQDPIPALFSLSMTKAAQRNLVQSLQITFQPEVRIALLDVAGPVSEEDEVFCPKRIAEAMWGVYAQANEDWKGEVVYGGPE